MDSEAVSYLFVPLDEDLDRDLILTVEQHRNLTHQSRSKKRGHLRLHRIYKEKTLPLLQGK